MISFAPATSYAVVAPLFALLGMGMGLAVPSTGAAVMAAAPRERSGTASATMNALRQGGMTIGIALLGTIMGARAVTSLATHFTAANIPGADSLAALAVRKHAPPQGLALSSEVFHHLLADALSHGFSAAVTVAGLAGLFAAAVLLLVARRRPSTRQPIAAD